MLSIAHTSITHIWSFNALPNAKQWTCRFPKFNYTEPVKNKKIT